MMAYRPTKDSYERIKKYFKAAGIPIPPFCKTITIRWTVGEVALVNFEVMPECVPDMPMPIEGAKVETVVVGRTVLGDEIRSVGIEAQCEVSNGD